MNRPPETATSLSPVIHLVDDDAAVRDSLALLIGTVGLRVRTWSDPERFLAEFDRQGIGAIVLDVRMPGVSGLSVLDSLQASAADQPVIMLTGHGTVDLCRRAFKAGAVEFRVEKAGIVHCRVGRMSFDADKLRDNFVALLEQIMRHKPSISICSSATSGCPMAVALI